MSQSVLRRVMPFLAGCLLVAAPLWAQEEAGQIDVVVLREAPFAVPEGLTVRVRLKSITPNEPTAIQWRHGGEGQGGEIVRGLFPKPGSEDLWSEEANQLEVGEWSRPVKISSLADEFHEKFFLTVTTGRPGRVIDRETGARGEYSENVVFEFEFRFEDEVVKTLKEEGPDGGTVTLVIPAYRLTGESSPRSPKFLAELCGVLNYARLRATYLESLPWADWPVPKRYALINNIGGYGQGTGYGIRTTNREVTLTELRSLRQLGVNGFREGPGFLVEKIARGDEDAVVWKRAVIHHVSGFPVNRYQEGRGSDPQAGCPFGDNVATMIEEQVRHSLESALNQPVEEVWGLTVDEIGTVVDQTKEKKGHLADCPRCVRGFQEWLAERGLSPADFGADDWSTVRPVDLSDTEDERPWMNDPHLALAAYYTRDFSNHVTAMLFTRLRTAFAEANAAKQRALDRNEAVDAARQPWIYSYALRGNTFLMKGHSLDFFDFYRLADNAIVYETSNREPRIWGWDSYLCDVQRIVAQRMGLARGIYIKPHRGAPLQRMLSAVSRGNTMLYWYTYGPDYKKGDSFSQDLEALRLTSKAAHLLGRAEEALYGATWARPAEVAVVKPETTQRWMNLSGDPPHLVAAWENAKWVYSALQHAHIPMDPLDEQMLAEEDLSRYKIIYVSGSHVTRSAAKALERYVRNGGVLYTSGWGLARDEANQPLDILAPVLGLQDRAAPEMWYRVALYGATALESYGEPENRIAPVPADAALSTPEGGTELRIGRECLKPMDDADVLTRFADGTAAVTRHRHGKGVAYVGGFFPGLEYSAAVRRPDYDMRRDMGDFRAAVAGPALELTKTVVDASDPLLEGILLKNPDNGLHAITLANWAYGVTALREDARGRRSPVVQILPCQDVEVTVGVPLEISEVTSCMLGQDLSFDVRNGLVTIRVPTLEEGDVLILH